MRRLSLYTFVIGALCAAVPTLAEDTPPKTWVDPDTGHRVYRLTDEPNSASLYFNQNGYTADGKKLVYTTPEGISTFDLQSTRPKGGGRTRARHRHRSQDAERLLHQGNYSGNDNAVWATDVDTLVSKRSPKSRRTLRCRP